MAESVLNNQVYELLGVKPVINAGGTHTTHGGSRMKQEVIEAMATASRSFVPVVELNRKAGEYIAKVTGAETGMVTSGAASGITLATAACMAGNDPAKIRRLPETSGMKNEIVMQMHHYGVYGNTHSFAGARVVLAGSAVGCIEEEVEAAITEKTAAVAYLFAPGLRQTGISLQKTVEVAHRHSVPVMVDAAAMLPPRENLRRYIGEGADLVIFSGGKFIGGPQATGLLFGKKDLVEAALVNASPHHAIGRPQKVAREEIVGLATALRVYMDTDEEALLAGLRGKAEYVASRIRSADGVRVEVKHDYFRYFVPTAVIELRPGRDGPTVAEIARRLHEGSPRIYVASSGDSLNVNTFNLQDGEEEIVAKRLIEELYR
jgi:L-seryl-tRNA(Ser) seleniumtransferase